MEFCFGLFFWIMLSSLSLHNPIFAFNYRQLIDVPLSINWKDLGAVTPFRNQGSSCDSDWAFSAVGAIEGINKISKGVLPSLSVQQLIDCDNTNDGCNGGLPDGSFYFILQNGAGLLTEKQYPYEAAAGTCRVDRDSYDYWISGYELVPRGSEKALMQAVAHQPVSARIAVGDEFKHYGSDDVFTGGCGGELNHAVLIIGYGTNENGTKYWLLKNSRGDWGGGAYVKLARDTGYGGLCGIALEASYPTMA